MAFSSGDVLTAANLNDLNIDSLTVDTSTLVVDKTNDKVGIGTTTPMRKLDVEQEVLIHHGDHAWLWQSDGGDLKLWYQSSYTSGDSGWVQHLDIDANGIVGVGGTTNPGTDAKFVINDATNGGSVYVSSSSATAVLQKGYSDNGSSETLQFVIRGDGDFESRSNSYGAISDERAKTNIVDANSHTEDLKKLRVVNYQLSHQWDEEKEEFKELEELGERHIGLIAQEVEQHFPKLVKDNDGPKSVKYSLLVPMLLQTIQELLDRVEALEAK